MIAATDTATVAPGPVMTRVDFPLLLRSETNPRKVFPLDYLHELRDSILEKGIKTPLMVRPHRTVEGSYEIIAGECRHRSTELALESLAALFDSDTDETTEEQIRYQALYAVPVIIEDMSDTDVLELQLIENLQRKDLSPLEEAEAYDRMLKLVDADGAPIYTVELLAKKLGRGTAQIYAARKWTRLPEVARLALDRGIIGKHHASAIARVPGEWERLCAAVEILNGEPYENVLDRDEEDVRANNKELIEAIKSGESLTVLTVAESRDALHQNYMIDLGRAPFPLDDTALVERATDTRGVTFGGSCMDCPLRTGSNPEYADELQQVLRAERGRMGGMSQGGMSPNICTLPACYHDKVKACAARKLAEAKESGSQVIEDSKAAKKIFNEYPPYALPFKGSPWVDLETKPGFELVGHFHEAKSTNWRALLAGLEVPVTTVVDPGGIARELVNRDQAVAAVNLEALKKGKESPFARAEAARDRPAPIETSGVKVEGGKLEAQVEAYQKELAEREAQEKAKVEEEDRIAKLTRVECFRLVGEKAPAVTLGQQGGYLLLRLSLDQCGIEGAKMVATMLLVEPEKPKVESLCAHHYAAAIMEHLQESPRTLNELSALSLLALSANEMTWKGLDSPKLKSVMQHYGAAMTEAKLRAREAVRATRKGKGKRKGNKEEPPTEEMSNETKNYLANDKVKKAAILSGTENLPEEEGEEDQEVLALEDRPAPGTTVWWGSGGEIQRGTVIPDEEYRHMLDGPEYDPAPPGEKITVPVRCNLGKRSGSVTVVDVAGMTVGSAPVPEEVDPSFKTPDSASKAAQVVETVKKKVAAKKVSKKPSVDQWLEKKEWSGRQMSPPVVGKLSGKSTPKKAPAKKVAKKATKKAAAKTTSKKKGTK